MSSDGFQLALIRIRCRTLLLCSLSKLLNLIIKLKLNLIIKINFNKKFRFDGISVEDAKSTYFDHWNIYHLAIYLNRPFTTGSYVFDAKTEIMRLESGEWESGPDYPFHSE